MGLPVLYSRSLLAICCVHSESHSVVSNSVTPWALQSMEFSRPEYGVGSLFLLQGIFPTQRPKPAFPHCRRILCQLTHRGSPGILEWGACPFSRGSSRPRNQLGSPALQEGSLPADPPGEPW